MRHALLISILAVALATAGCTAGKSAAPPEMPSGMPSAAPSGADAALLASYPAEVQSAVMEAKQKEGTRTVTVGDDLWIIITAGHNPGASLPILSAENKNGVIEVVYMIEPLTGIVSATGLTPQPWNVLQIKGAAKTPVTFRRAQS